MHIEINRIGTVSNKLLGGLNRFYVYKTLILYAGSTAVHKHESYLVRVKAFQLTNASKYMSEPF